MRIHFIFIVVTLLIGCKQEAEMIQDPPRIGFFGEFLDEWTFDAVPFGNFDEGVFRIWLPEGLGSNAKAILVLGYGFNGTSLGLPYQAAWQDYARREQLILVGYLLRSEPNSNGIYTTANEGSGSALLKAIDTIAVKNGLGSLNDLPILIRGYSAGGVFGYNFSSYQPERTLAFVNIRGGGVENPGEANRKIPGLMITGEFDDESRNTRIAEVVKSNRMNNGLWSYAQEPGADHFASTGAADELVKVFFSKVLEKRFGTDTLVDLEVQEGWLGNNETLKIDSFLNYQDDRTSASWLIDGEFAQLWQRFQVD